MYKIIYNNKIIDVIESPQFIKILRNGNVALTDKYFANGIAGSNNVIYSFEPVTRPDVKVVAIEAISKEEFSRLQNLLNSDTEVVANENKLTAARKVVIENLSKICQSRIVDGFKIILSDGKLYHFRLTTEDQLNLISIENQLNTGAQSILYHASSEPCKIFTREDMFKVVRAFRKHVLYHTTYFNAAKQYINTLTEPEKLERFAYNDDVSFAVSDPEVRRILRRNRSDI
jgi:hypothetical protein